MSEKLTPRSHLLIDPEFSTVLLGQSKALLDAVDKAKCIADDPATVLILGESGTGKEEVARGLHRLSGRPGPFVAVNCAALPTELSESLLFGHAKGAFTTADREEIGLIRQSHHGTLFLDEVGELNPLLQAKLLRVLQEHAVLPIGCKAEVPVDFRVVAATNRDLRRMAREGRFREDLLARLEEWVVTLPPFRARGRDPILVLDYFIRREARKRHQSARVMSRAASTLILRHPWLANARELQRVAKSLVLGRGTAPISGPELRAVLLAHEGDLVGDELRQALSVRISRGDGPTRAQLCQDLQRGKSVVCEALNVLILSGQIYRRPGGRTPRYFPMSAGAIESERDGAASSDPAEPGTSQVESLPAREPLSKEARILRMAAGGRVTTKVICSALKCSRKTASRLLTGLENAGLLERHGRGAATYYERSR